MNLWVTMNSVSLTRVTPSTGGGGGWGAAPSPAEASGAGGGDAPEATGATTMFSGTEAGAAGAQAAARRMGSRGPRTFAAYWPRTMMLSSSSFTAGPSE
jgi:hypothetical protein